MKRVFLLMVVSALLVTFGIAQTPEAGSNTDSANVKGCLGGSDGNYTVLEDGSRQIFKITTSSVDLKPHLGHEVSLIGHRASGAVSSGAADNSLAVTELTMISEHCAAAAAATVGAVVPYSQTVVEPTTATPPSAPASIPAVDAAAPAATVNPSSATVSTPAADTAHPTRPSSHARRLSATKAAGAAAPAATVSPSSETVRHTAADAATPATTASSSSETASAPAAAATTPTVPRRAGSLSLLVSFVVLVIVLATLVPLLLRWRKRKMLERAGAQNLSFTNEASSDRDKPGLRKVA